jgi:hypothetical protein
MRASRIANPYIIYRLFGKIIKDQSKANRVFEALIYQFFLYKTQRYGYFGRDDNGNGAILDVIYLIVFLYQSGPEPICP